MLLDWVRKSLFWISARLEIVIYTILFWSTLNSEGIRREYDESAKKFIIYYIYIKITPSTKPALW